MGAMDVMGAMGTMGTMVHERPSDMVTHRPLASSRELFRDVLMCLLPLVPSPLLSSLLFSCLCFVVACRAGAGAGAGVSLCVSFALCVCLVVLQRR